MSLSLFFWLSCFCLVFILFYVAWTNFEYKARFKTTGKKFLCVFLELALKFLKNFAAYFIPVTCHLSSNRCGGIPKKHISIVRLIESRALRSILIGPLSSIVSAAKFCFTILGRRQIKDIFRSWNLNVKLRIAFNYHFFSCWRYVKYISDWTFRANHLWIN